MQDDSVPSIIQILPPNTYPPDIEQINSMGRLWNEDNIKISYNQTFEIEGKKRRVTLIVSHETHS